MGQVPHTPIFTGAFVPVNSVSPSGVNWFLKEDPGELVAEHEELEGGVFWWLREQFCRQTNLSLSCWSGLCLGRLSDLCELQFVMAMIITPYLLEQCYPIAPPSAMEIHLIVQYSSHQPHVLLSTPNEASVTKELSLNGIFINVS